MNYWRIHEAGFERIKTSYQNLKHRKDASTNLDSDQSGMAEKIATSMKHLLRRWMMTLIQQMAISVLFELSKLAN